MHHPFIFSPDTIVAGGQPAITAAVADTHVRHINTVPTKDADLANVAASVSATWAAETWLTIKYKTATDFAAEATQFNRLLQQRNMAGGGSHGLSADLHEMDAQADDAIPYVKNFAFGIWGPKLAANHYGEFGIEHHGNKYELPYDRHKRSGAIVTLIDGLKKYKLTAGNYGADWWTDYLTRYNAALATSEGSAKNISGFVGELNQLRTSIRRTLQSVLHILEGNFPDTFEQERRTWGFLKDRY